MLPKVSDINGGGEEEVPEISHEQIVSLQKLAGALLNFQSVPKYVGYSTEVLPRSTCHQKFADLLGNRRVMQNAIMRLK